MLELIDSHAHVNFDSYKDDREEMMQRAYDTGVKTIVHPCCNLEEIPKLVALSKEYDGVGKTQLYYAVGVHPTDTKSWTDESIEIIEAHLAEVLAAPGSKLRAIGETGLDYFHGKTDEARALQAEAFRAQIAIAKKHKLPIIIHTRDCWEDTLKILQEEYPKDRNAKAGVLHCYTGDLDFARACIELGFYVSWSGIVTFKNSGLKEVASEIPLDRTLVETDCPFLAPTPHRSQRNEPSYVNHVAETVAEAKSISKEELAQATTQNARDLFRL